MFSFLSKLQPCYLKILSAFLRIADRKSAILVLGKKTSCDPRQNVALSPGRGFIVFSPLISMHQTIFNMALWWGTFEIVLNSIWFLLYLHSSTIVTEDNSDLSTLPQVANSPKCYVLFIHTWHRLTRVLRSPALSVSDWGLLNISEISTVASQKLYELT